MLQIIDGVSPFTEGEVRVGVDPELAIRAHSGPNKDRWLPAHRFFPAKEDAIVVPGAGKVFRDGAAVEFNPYPSTQPVTVIRNMGALMKKAQEVIGKDNHLEAISTMEIDLEDFLKDAPADVLMGGCRPSLNAYGRKCHVPSATHYPLRHMAGHIHLSPAMGARDWVKYLLGNTALYPALVACLDAFLGARLREMFHSPAYEKRSAIYGQWGEYREHTYPAITLGMVVKGVEYRTPGAEMWSAPALALLALQTAVWVVLNSEELITKMNVPGRAGLGETGPFAFFPGGKGWKWGESVLDFCIPGLFNASTIRLFSERWKSDFISPEVEGSEFLFPTPWERYASSLNVTVPSRAAAAAAA